MDAVRFHKLAAVQEAIEGRGAVLVYSRSGFFAGLTHINASLQE
jgi:hypothetical protein